MFKGLNFQKGRNKINKIDIYYNCSVPEIYENGVYEKNNFITHTGALATFSGEKTGRCPKDKHVLCKDKIWIGENSPNISMSPELYEKNRQRAIDFLSSKKKLYIFDGYIGWDENYRIKVRIICSRAYHALFANNMLIRPSIEELENFGNADFTIYNAGEFPSNKLNNSTTSIDLNLDEKEIVILGTKYAGEMKKSLFSVMHYILPQKNVLSLHSSVNESKKDKSTTIFFGLSGTGKTTLSADPNRKLIGDDEHGWSDNGVFNFEGGCYAKCINLSKDNEPSIYNAIRFGSVLENIKFDVNRIIDYNDVSITENTRACYPIDFLDNVRIPCIGRHPTNIILLTCDCFGVLPPVSKLSSREVMFYFINGYTSKIPGTEDKILEPTATFSSCFGDAFLVWHPVRYAKLLAEKMKQHKTNAWLINTGWISGKYGEGSRISLKYTREIIDQIHDGTLVNQEYNNLPIFNLKYPRQCGSIPEEILDPQKSWKNKEEYMLTLKKLGKLFYLNYNKFEDSDIDLTDCLPELTKN